MPDVLAYVLLFTGVGAFFIFSHLLIGKLVRPARPDPEKLTIYECGEPTIGSAWIQFDLRFYVVALLFVIFDVEMAFFFPWAVVFGRANTLADQDLPGPQRVALVREMTTPADWRLPTESADAEPMRWRNFEESAQRPLRTPAERGREPNRLAARITEAENNREGARSFGWIALADILVFFAVLLVGFAYLWKRGDLNWVRSVAAQEPAITEPSPTAGAETEPVLAE
jgi:NADH-quinone oxidoreductase subunit A